MRKDRLTISTGVISIITLAAMFLMLMPFQIMAADQPARELVQGPVQPVPPAGRVVKMAAGLTHSGMIQYDGSVWLWGDNRFGQAGQADQDFVEQPQRLQLFDKAVDLSLGFYHTLILGESGNVYALGRNTLGQLGRSDMTGTSRPVRVAQLPFITSISAGSLHSLALAEDGSVWAWGSNSFSQVGKVRDEVIRDQEGQTIGRRQAVPVKIVEKDAVAIAAGGHHSLYLDRSGQVYAWGANERGQLGLTEVAEQGVPQQIDGLKPVVSLSAGYQHNLAVVKIEGRPDQLYAWGDHSLGQTGTGLPVSEDAMISTPQIIDWQSRCPDPEMTMSIDLIAAGAAHSALLARAPDQKNGRSDRQYLLMWGDNSSIQLSSQITSDGSAVPVLLTVQADEHQGSAFRVMDSLALGGSHTLILSSRGLAAVTGLNDQYQTGMPAAGKIAGFQPLIIEDMIKPAFIDNSMITATWKSSANQLTIKWPAAYDNHDLQVDYQVRISDRHRLLEMIETRSSPVVFEGLDPQTDLEITVSVRDQAHRSLPDQELSRLTAYWLPVGTSPDSDEAAQWPDGIQTTDYAADQQLHQWRPIAGTNFEPLEVPWSLNEYYGEIVIAPPRQPILPLLLASAGIIGLLTLIGLLRRKKQRRNRSEREAAGKENTDTDQ